MPDRIKRIAVLGGGVGALTAAYELTSDPDWKTKYEITVYSLGWRLGGKGASGRNRRQFDRIEEHGLHLWFGYYENAFALMRRCYAELGRRPDEPLAAWQDAFHKQSLFVTGEFYGGRWSFWPLAAPENDEVPGDGEVPTLWECLDRVLDFMHRHFLAHLPDSPNPSAEHPSWLREIIARIEAEVAHVPWALVPLHAARELLRRAAEAEAAAFEPILRCLDAFAERARAAVDAKLCGVDLDSHPDLRRLLEVLELGYASVKGILADDVLRRGFDSIDDLDYRDWLAKHGAGEVGLNADVLRVAYETIFAYRDGDYRQPDLAAGTALRGLLRLCFTYKGAIGWKMQAGMGDTVFTPLYLVLCRRGVRFEFFSRVKELGLSADGERIETVLIGRQATVERSPYQPLVAVKDLPCWPSEPLYDQLVEGKQLDEQGVDLESYWAKWTDVEDRRLHCGEDFDDVVLGISIGALPILCRALIDARPAWRAMVEHVKVAGTQAFQLWLRPNLAALGWDPRLASPVLGGFAQPQDTWADMSQLIPRESWPGEVGSIAYFCGPLALSPEIPPPDDHDFPSREQGRARSRAEQWIASNGGILWPSSTGKGYPGGFRDVFDDAEVLGGYWRANVDPAERYVLSPSGSTKHRLAAGESGFANLFLAGDWTANGLNYGCVEAAVMSGMQAARALCGSPALIFGERDFGKP